MATTGQRGFNSMPGRRPSDNNTIYDPARKLAPARELELRNRLFALRVARHYAMPCVPDCPKCAEYRRLEAELNACKNAIDQPSNLEWI
jgi:hypothetical protein